MNFINCYMTPTQEQMQKWIQLSQVSNCVIEFSIDNFIKNPKKYLSRMLLEAFVEIQRWDPLVNNVFVHKATLNYLIDHVDQVEQNSLGQHFIWNSDIVACNHLPTDIILCYCKLNPEWNIPEEEGRHVSMVKLNINLANKLSNMKAFW